ncbi:GerMN domain-containing protein [Geodermatophilus sp. DF01-2]|uniref:GerMN domain-containing protein n=1 Tax=Geodermatophilus sp. DF01-2 TaxID=2559610 RepID=UPI00142FD6A2|nr:GerMN domain-containing protein [Geodermatophilus sp. DF01_2]
MTRLLVTLLALVLVTGCGLSASGPVERVSVPTPPPDPAGPPLGGGWKEIAVYFVHDSRLEAVPRRVAERRPQTAVDLLLAGPTRTEVLAGLRTALSPQDLVVLSGPEVAGTVTVAVGREFAGIAGTNQLLAVAQVVWTVTQFLHVDRVCFTLDGAFVEVPTDAGLSDQPVSRADYLSVAPRPGDPETTAPADTTPAERSSG